MACPFLCLLAPPGPGCQGSKEQGVLHPSLAVGAVRRRNVCNGKGPKIGLGADGGPRWALLSLHRAGKGKQKKVTYGLLNIVGFIHYSCQGGPHV